MGGGRQDDRSFSVNGSRRGGGCSMKLMHHNVGLAWCHSKANQYSILHVKMQVYATFSVVNFKMCLLADEFKAAASVFKQG